MIMILLMLLQTALLAFSQVALKLAMKNLEWEWSWSFIWHHVLLNAWLMFAILLMIAANLFWLVMLHKYDFSKVYPLTSLGFIFGILAGLFVFHEQVGFMQWIGVAMVITGCMFIAEIGKNKKPKEENKPVTVEEAPLTEPDAQKTIHYEDEQNNRENQDLVGGC